MTFNGEIYNHAQLRRELTAAGHRFSSMCDTEVLLHLYEEYGEDCVHRLRGMYAFALWDIDAQTLFLARDPFGIKPLYYADQGGVFWFASQVKPLAAAGLGPTRSAAGAAGFLLFGSVPEPFTIHDDIRAVPAGSTMKVDGCGIGQARRFFSLPSAIVDAESSAEHREDSLQAVRAALVESVRAHLVADVDVGVFLSSGIDSTALLGLAAQEGSALAAITLGFDEYGGTARDEVPLAAVTAAQYGAVHRVRVITRADFSSASQRILDDMDQPTIDGLNTWFVSRAAAEEGLKVALSGVGGDELFFGYSNFVSVPEWARRLRSLASIPNLGRGLRVVSRPLVGQRWPKAPGLVEYGASAERLWFTKRALFMPWELPQILGPELAHRGLEELDLAGVLGAVLDPRPGTAEGIVAALEAGLYMRNQLLRDTDWASMAHSLEVRVPLVDARLMNAVAPIVFAHPKRNLKADLLGRAPTISLPDAVLTRPKTGFGVPAAEWLADPQRRGRTATARKMNKSARTPWARRWAAVVGERFGLFESPAGVTP